VRHLSWTSHSCRGGPATASGCCRRLTDCWLGLRFFRSEPCPASPPPLADSASTQPRQRLPPRRATHSRPSSMVARRTCHSRGQAAPYFTAPVFRVAPNWEERNQSSLKRWGACSPRLQNARAYVQSTVELSGACARKHPSPPPLARSDQEHKFTCKSSCYRLALLHSLSQRFLSLTLFTAAPHNELHAHPHFRVPTTSHRARLASRRAGSHKGPGWQVLDQGTSMPSGLSSPRARMS
jgi:hypothetical protein